MRHVYPSDLDTVTRTLMACEAAHRPELARRIVMQAGIADRYRQRLGKYHSTFGSGTLSSAAQAYPRVPAHVHCDADYLCCLGFLLDALSDRVPDQAS